MVTFNEVKIWLGGDGNLSTDEMIGLILDIANGDYHPLILHNNIVEFTQKKESNDEKY